MKSRDATIFSHCLLIFLIVVLTFFSSNLTVNQASADTVKCESCGAGGQTAATSGSPRYPIMRYTPEQIKAENRLLETAPLVHIDRTVQLKSMADGYTEGASRSLLSLLGYDYKQRNQGNSCGSCWAWTGTGCLEVALRVQRGITDNRLSVQYFNSTYNGGSGAWACCGGDASTFATYYSGTLKKAIPWSNTNAGYVDGSRLCSSSTAMPAGSISTTPNYPISSVTSYRIQTYSYEVSQATAIANIKSVLDQNKAIYFGFTLANSADWTQFYNFWDYQSESYLWPYEYSCGHDWNPAQGGGHAVLCVGYDDTPAGTTNDYWVMLNSWGTSAGHTNGLFRVPMYYNYDCSISGYGYSTRWWTIEPTFTGVTPPTVTTYGYRDLTNTSVRLISDLTNLGSASSASVSFMYGTTIDCSGGTSSTKTFSAPIHFGIPLSGLSPGTTYYYKAKAVGNGTGYGSVLSFTTSGGSAPPTVSTYGHSQLTSTSVRLIGDLTSLGSASSVKVSFVYGTTTACSGGTSLIKTFSGPIHFGIPLSGLSPGTTYYYKAKAVGSGTSYGAVLSFTTSTPPTVTTSGYRQLTDTSVRLLGDFTNLGSASSVVVSFMYGTTPECTSSTFYTKTFSAPIYFGIPVSGLSPGTTYYYKAKAVGNGTGYGGVLSFTTIN